MSYSQTPNYSLYKPTVNADNDQWGTHLNNNADTLDSVIHNVSTSVPSASTTAPLIESGAGAVGTSAAYARADHVHPQFGSTGASIVVSDTAPASPTAGALWWDSVGGQMYLYYQDPNSSEWVPVVNQSGQLSAAVAANTGRNLVHNGLFNVQQRGTGTWTTSGLYTADRWQMFAATDTFTTNVTAVVDANRAAIGDEAATSQYDVQVNGVSTGQTFIAHRIENVRRLGGKTVTVSFWAAASVAGLKVGVQVGQCFGTGGSPSATTSPNGQAVTLTTSYARYSVTFNVASTSGTVLGTNNDHYTFLYFFLSAGGFSQPSGGIGTQTGHFWFWGVQLEIGSVATPLEKRDPQQELALCQRYYCIGTHRIDGTASAANMWWGDWIAFPVAMRASPSVTLGTWGGGSPTNVTGVIANIASQWGWEIAFQNVSAAGFNDGSSWYASADL